MSILWLKFMRTSGLVDFDLKMATLVTVRAGKTYFFGKNF